MAFACRPRLIVLDEPTTGLDVTTQRRVLDTVRGLCRTYQVAAVYISHDLAVVAEIADHVAVMYSGRLIEIGAASELFATPGPSVHPRADAGHPLHGELPRAARHGRLSAAPGQPPGRLLVPAALRVRDRRMRAARAAAGRRVGHRARGQVRARRGGHRAVRHRRCRPESARHPRPRNRCSRSAGYRSPTRTSRCCGTSTSTWEPRRRSRSSAPRGRARPRWRGASSGCTRTGRGRSRSAASQLPPGVRGRTQDQLRKIQFVAQNPYSSLNPRQTVGQIIGHPLSHFSKLPRQGARQADRGRADLGRAAGVVRGALPRRAVRRGTAAGRAGPRPRRRP